MSKITKKQLLKFCDENNDAINELQSQSDSTDFLLAVLIQQLKDGGVINEVSPEPKPKPKLKQLDQSAFNHPYVDDRFNYVALNADGQAVFFESKPVISNCLDIWVVHTGSVMPMLKGYDASNWQNSLIERESKELTGSDYYHSRIASHLLESSQKLVVCFASNISEADALSEKRIEVITSVDTEFTDADEYGWQFVVPINNQGEPLTASEAGF